MKHTHVLESFNLYYEDLERKKVKVTPVKQSKKTTKSTKQVKNSKSFKENVLDRLQPVRSKLNNVYAQLKNPRKKAKKRTKAEQEQLKQQNKNAILGIGLLLVVVSIAYSTSVIYIGVDSDASRLALLPQVVFALATLFKAFSKLYK